ncbi:TolC family protein [bacterium]|nr:TolC family protein [bacterium]
MKRFYINCLIAILISGIAGISFNTAQAFGLKHNKKSQAVSVSKDNKKDYNIDNRAKYTNDIHSVFSLDDCIRIAIEYNPSIQASFYNQDAYKSRIGQAWANYFPSINVGFELSRTWNHYNKEIFPYYSRNVYNTTGYVPTVSANMLLFDFGKTKAIADMAKRQYEGAQENSKENINVIIYDIKATYYNILFAQAQVQVYKDTVKDYELQLSQAKGFYVYGKKPKLDVVTAEYNLGKAKLNLVKAEEILKVAKIRLSKIMGIPEYTNYELSDEMSLNKFGIDTDEAIKLAFEVRPELISAQKEMEAAKMNLRAEKRNFTPNISIYGSYANNLGSEYNVNTAQVGVGLNYNGLNILKIKKKVDEARSTYNMTKAQYQEIKDTVYFNVKKCYTELQTAAEAIVMAKLALDQAKEQYRQVTGRYKAGVGDAIELKDGENTYLNARLDFYNAILNYNVTAANLEQEIGIPLKQAEEKVIDIKQEDL